MTSTLTADAIGRAGEAAAGRWLEHYGRIGMRWGVRRSPAQLAADPKGRIPADPDAIKAVETALKIKSAGSLNVVSSQDLQQLVTRMNLEQKYIKASLETNPATKKGEGFVKKFIKNEIEQYGKGKKGPATMLVSQLMAMDKEAKADGVPAVKAAQQVAKALKGGGKVQAPKKEKKGKDKGK